jgi:hypothetical protein
MNSVKKTTYLSIAAVAVFASLVLYVAMRPASSQAYDLPQDGLSANAASGPVVVELFTSEGCSDCPAADALLAQLDKQTVPGANVIVLEHHVDYWNGDGWPDPFSSTVATDRQRRYAFGRSGDQIYTPEMIVDGGDGFVGSNARQAQRAISEAAKLPKASVKLSWSGDESNLARALHVSVSPLNQATGDRPLIFLAVTESHLHSNVRRGENAGRSLDHSGVVRHFAQIGKAGNPTKDGFIFDSTANLKLAADWKRPDLRAIVFLQDPKSMRVLGAAALPF